MSSGVKRCGTVTERLWFRIYEKRAGCRCFSLIEVVLGLGLISVGVLRVVGLLPFGLSATRNSIAESYAADSADQFLHFLAMRLKSSTNDYQAWDDFGKKLPTTKPSATEPSQTWTEWYSEDTATFWYAGSHSEYYKVEQKAAGSDTPDFAAVYRVWRGSVSASAYVNGTWQTTTLSDDEALSINVEISWPLVLSYQRREKALYSLEVYKPQ